MGDGRVGAAREGAPRLGDQGHRPPFLPDRDHLRHRVAHITRQVLHLLRVATKVRRVVREVRVAALHDHALQVVEVRVQAVRPAEPDGVAPRPPGRASGARPGVPCARGTAARRRRPGLRAAASRGPRRPGGPRSASTSPSRFANTTADEASARSRDGRGRPRRARPRTAAIVRSERIASESTRVPSMSRARSRIGNAGEGRTLGRRSLKRDARPGRVAGARRGPAGRRTASPASGSRPPRRSSPPGRPRSRAARPHPARARPAGAR